MSRTERGMFVEGDIIEVAPGDAYTQCHFHDCEFVGIGPALFMDCVFGTSPGKDIPLVRESSYIGCLFWGGGDASRERVI